MRTNQQPTIVSPNANDPTPTIVPNHFVTREGEILLMDGKPYKSIGTNRYNLLTYSDPTGEFGIRGCANPFTEEDLVTTFDTFESLGITTVRFWLFQKFTKSGTDLNRFNLVLRLAEERQIKVIPVLENHFEDCTNGGDKTASWYARDYSQPYEGYALSLPEYINTVVPKYKDNPTILMWEIMNEAETDDEEALYIFGDRLSSQIKSLDPNHLVSLGLSGRKASDALHRQISFIQTIDVVDYHDYDKDTTSSPQSLQKRFIDAKETGKPIIIGEAGILKKVENRPELFRRKIADYFGNGGSVYLIWSYGERWVTNDGYNFDQNDPLAEVVRRTAQEISK